MDITFRVKEKVWFGLVFIASAGILIHGLLKYVI